MAPKIIDKNEYAYLFIYLQVLFKFLVLLAFPNAHRSHTLIIPDPTIMKKI
jgi:hypothetical protein